MWGFIHKWHRKIGITAAFFVMLLVITGLLLNHTDNLNLQNMFVKNNILLDWYHIQPEGEGRGFMVNQHWVTQINSRLYFDQREIADHIDHLIGVVMLSDEFVVALEGSLLILTLSGEIVEGLAGAEGVPAGIKSIGLSEKGELVIRAAHGDYLADLDATEWHEEEGLVVNWSESQEIPKDLYNQLLILYRGKGLPVERVILDIHSGRILGYAGVLLVDFMAILFLLLAMSGVWMWVKYR
ncbi:MAG: PepSY domain-containing protein [Proteobacteria bacterium]|nr:PepSY domain-containing protein [Pseudomonadota bacterium]